MSQRPSHRVPHGVAHPAPTIVRRSGAKAGRPPRARFGDLPPLWFVLGLLVLFDLAGPAVALPVHANALRPEATFNVTKTEDTADGTCGADCSLREAVLAANVSPGADTIVIPAGLYNLARFGTGEDAGLTGDLDVTGNVTITGAGADMTVIDGQLADRVIHVLPGATVTISGVTIRDGVATAEDGGGIFSQGTLTLNDSIVAINLSTNGWSGGGIASEGMLTVNRSIVINNRAQVGGGLYFTGAGAVVAINNSTISGNQGTWGAGVYNIFATVGITNTLIAGNHSYDTGGGLHNRKTLTLFASTVRENDARVQGGGIYNESGTTNVNASAVISNSVYWQNNVAGGGIANWAILNLTDSTIGANSAHAANVCPGGGTCSTSYVAHGGGIYNGWTLTMVNSTLNRNSALADGDYGNYVPGTGAGLYNGGLINGANVQIKNTIIANSLGYQNNAISNCGSMSPATMQSNGHNLDSGNTCGFSDPTDKVSVDPQLAALRPFFTYPPVYPLPSSSPAVDGGDNTGCPALDQRGVPRPQDGDGNGTATCDIGAFEYGRYVANVALASSLNPSTVGQSVLFTATVSAAQTPPSGTVTFKDATTVICSAVPIAAGQATCAFVFSSPGSHAITAAYSGDTTFGASTGTLAGGQTVNPIKLFIPMVRR